MTTPNRSTGLPPRALRQASNLLRVLAHPARLQLVELLMRDAPLTVSEITERLRMTQPAVSGHLRELRAARVVGGRRRGREVLYRLIAPEAADIVQLIHRQHFRSISFEGGEAI